VERMKAYLSTVAIGPEESAEVRYSITVALYHTNEDMIRFLVDRFGIPSGDIWLDLFIRNILRHPGNIPEITLIDFLISRGADINSTLNGRGMLEMAFDCGHWELVDALVARGLKLVSLDNVFKSTRVVRNVHLFRAHVVGNGLLEGVDWSSVVCLALKGLCSAEVLEEMFNLAYITDPSIVKLAFVETLSAKRSSDEFPDFVPFIKKLIAIDPSLAMVRLKDLTMPLRACEVYNPRVRATWSRNLGSMYRVPHLYDEWFDTYTDSESLEAIDGLAKTLIENGAETMLNEESGQVDDSLLSVLNLLSI
jgi:hypothetical protein